MAAEPSAKEVAAQRLAELFKSPEVVAALRNVS